MLRRTQYRLTRVPTPMAGLALAIASLGWCWENATSLAGAAKWSGALIAGVMLLVLTVKFIRFPKLLWQDLAHPVVGSVLPTLAMGWMVVSHSLGQWNSAAGQALWLAAVTLHLLFLCPQQRRPEGSVVLFSYKNPACRTISRGITKSKLDMNK